MTCVTATEVLSCTCVREEFSSYREQCYSTHSEFICNAIVLNIYQYDILQNKFVNQYVHWCLPKIGDACLSLGASWVSSGGIRLMAPTNLSAYLHHMNKSPNHSGSIQIVPGHRAREKLSFTLNKAGNHNAMTGLLQGIPDQPHCNLTCIKK